MAGVVGTPRLHVMAAVIVGPDGRLLIARRPEHLHQGGLWEFPGGKLEPGEGREAGLARELDEELGIRPTRCRPLIRVRYDYPGKPIELDVWRVEAFEGEPCGREGQPLRWVAPEDLPGLAFPPSNRPIVTAARLPDRYLVTGPFQDSADLLDRLDRALDRGVRLVQLRLGGGAEPALLRAAIARCRFVGARVLVNGEPARALELGADGVHLTAARVASLRERPVPPESWCAASCHDAQELAAAVALGVDFAVLSPVAPTRSHPGTPPLGWGRFAELVAALPIPVYALGGVSEADLPRAWTAGAQGIAAIGALWD